MPLNLDPDLLVGTGERLQQRIAERFEDSGLVGVCGHLIRLTKLAKTSRVEIVAPNVPLRVAMYGLITVLMIITLAAIAIALSSAEGSGEMTVIDLVGAVEASVNDLVLLGAAVYFFWSFETRSKRNRVVHALHDLRKLAHLIDIHQLTKDPGIFATPGVSTASSPKRQMTEFEMSRYLDYCSEMLSLTGKAAALYGDGFDDADTIKAINDLEELTIALQSKIWQKRALLHKS